MSTHTPGPWFHQVVPTSAGSAINISAANQKVAIIYVDGIRKGIDEELPKAIENLANARLISAAPDMLAALEAIVALDDGDSPDLWHFEKEFSAGIAAIKKAKGEPA